MPHPSYVVGALAVTSLLGGFLAHRFLDPTLGSVGIITGLVGLLVCAFYFVLHELGALDAPPPPPSVLESGPDILSVDLSDREDR